MQTTDNRPKAVADALPREGRDSTPRLLLKYTALFAIFFAAIFSPFWLYGKTFIFGTDGIAHHLPALTYTREWFRTVLGNLQAGRLEIPFWDLTIGFGQNTIGTNVLCRLFYNLYALLPEQTLEFYVIARTVVCLYASGLCFLAFAKTRVRDSDGLLLGSLLYVFSGFNLLYVAARHFFFLEMIMALPLMLLGVNQIFEGKRSWLFILVVARMACCDLYLLVNTTLPAVIYAAFHLFELSAKARRQRGGFWRILLRHVLHYLAGLGLAAVCLLPGLLVALDSSRIAEQPGMNLLFWKARVYINFFRSIMDLETVGNSGYISLTSVALIGVFYLIHSRKRRDKLVLWQIALYTLAFLIPALTMAFSGFVGKTQRWCYIFSFWTSIAAACALPRLIADEGRGRRFCLIAFAAYVVIYLVQSIWTDQEITICVILAMLVAGALFLVIFADWGRRHRRMASLVLFALVLVELTGKTYYKYAPQYKNYIAQYAEAGRLAQLANNNAADALDMAEDDGLYRTDVVITEYKSTVMQQVNYGVRSHVNGVSTYYNMTNERIVNYFLDLGNAQQTLPFKIMTMDQRTVLDELAGVKYVAALEDGKDRIPYGYELVGSREKALLDRTTQTEYLYRNKYALPLSYAYDSYIPRSDYDALPLNQREQAMLQGVVLETEVPLKRTELAFDDRVLLDHDAVMAALREDAQKNNGLEILDDGTIRVTSKNCNATIPIDPVEGELSLLVKNADYLSVNFYGEEAERLARDGASRLDVVNMKRKARTWKPVESADFIAASGSLSGRTILYGVDNSYYIGPRNYLLNMGCGKTSKKLKIIFGSVGDYRFDDIRLIVQPMDTYAKKVRPLRKRGAKSVDIDGNTVTVSYDLDADALACLAIPYSADWSATVDGEPAKILPANGMYMGVMLSQGEHTLVFTNRMRGFREGAAISVATAIGLIVYAIARRRRKRA